MKSSIKRSSSWPVSPSQDSTNKEPQKSSSFTETTDAGNSRRTNFESLCSLISEELKYLKEDPEVLKKYGETVFKQLKEAEDELVKLKELIKDMPESTPDDDPHFKTLRDELQKLKKRVSKLKAMFPSKVKIHHLENETKKVTDKLKKDSEILTSLTEQKLNLPTFYGDSVFKQSEIFGNFYSLYNDLGDNLKKKLCLLCFSVFPKEAEIRRRVMIYWWMAEGFIDKKIDGTSFLETFSKMGFIIPISIKPRSHIHSYKLHPMARIVLMYLARRACLFDFNKQDGTPTEKYYSSLQAFLVGQGLSDARNLERLHMIFNLNESTLEFKPVWFTRMLNINVLLLGRWQSNEAHHVEIENPEFLENLKHLQFLIFLSLQGVSRVTELPNSIMMLESLKILDLRACHNLEVIPAGIGGLKNLTHLDMSDCYLIDHMPREISNLENLKVLMGFVVGDPKDNRMKKKSPCTLKDLGRLKKLEKLGIYMSVANFEYEDLKALQGFISLKILSISWGSESKERLANSGENTKGKTQSKADNEALKKKTEATEKKIKEATEKKIKEAPKKKKLGKCVRIKDVVDESAKSADQASPQTTTKQEDPQVSNDGAEKSTGATEKTISQKLENAAETSPEVTQPDGPEIRKDEADKSIGANEDVSPQVIKDAVHKSTEETRQASPQSHNDQESLVTAKDVIEKATATTEQASPSKVADVEKPNSETSKQASPKIRKDEANNSVGTTEQTSNQEIKKATVQHASPQIETYDAEKSTEAIDQTTAETTNEQAGHQTLKDIIDKSTTITEQESPQTEKKEEDLAVKKTEQEKPQAATDSADAHKQNAAQADNSADKTTEQESPQTEKKEEDLALKKTEQEKPQAVTDSADAHKQNAAQADNSADIPENITKKKDQENEKNEGEEKIEPKTNEDTKMTNSEVEGQGEGMVEDKQSLSTPVVASKKEAEGEISRAIDDNPGISEDSKKKINQENEADEEDNIEYKKDILTPSTSKKQTEANTEKVTGNYDQENKQGNNLPVMTTTSKLPIGRCFKRSQTILGTLGNVFHSGDQGPASGSSDLTLPRTLEKLQLVCYPEINAPNWLKPESLQSLKKLYISGGKLRNLGKIYDWNDGKPDFTKNTWKVHTLRLKYLSHMQMTWKELRHLFPSLVNLEKICCPKLTFFPCDGDGMWIDKTKTIPQ